MMKSSIRSQRLLSASAACLALLAVPVQAGGAAPSGGKFVAGAGTIGGNSGSVTVGQSSTTGIIDWNSFSIGKNNSVTFDNGAGATLNEVTGGNLSVIAGALHATGSLYLINQDGIIVSGSGRIVTGGSFGASTQDGSGMQRGNILDAGTIRSAHGTVRLSGVNVSVPGSIAVMRGGRIWLTSAGTTAIAGTLDADNARGAGGTIVATGKSVAVAGSANIRASGATGGTVLLGGDIHGGAIAADDFVKNDVATAATTTVAKGATIAADASQGAGGDIVVWSNAHTVFDGTIAARGKTSGGFAEVSSHDLLGFGGHVGLTAKSGRTGTLLLDPENVVIEDGTTANGGFDGGSPTDTYTASGDDSVLSVADLEAALATANVVVTTGGAGSPGSQTGDITVLAPVMWSANTLTLDAFHSIYINATLAATGTAGLSLITNDGGIGGDYSFNGGNITFANTSEALTINGQAYTLVGSMSDLENINANLGGYYALANSIDASSDPTTPASWIPIGTDGAGNIANSGNGFSGVFEGLGNTISNLAINLPNVNYVGVFGYSSGTIRDVGIVGGSIAGASWVGGLVGQNAGTITNGYSTAAISGSSDVGGLVGDNQGSIGSSYATGAVSGTSNVGGLAGENDGDISDGYATGAVSGTSNIGGLVGDNFGSIESAYSTGSVSGTTNIGGFVGSNESGATISSGVWATDSSGQTVGLGADANDQSGNVTGLTSAQLQGALPSGFDSTLWGTAPGSLPFLLGQSPYDQVEVITTPITFAPDPVVTSLMLSAAGARTASAGTSPSDVGNPNATPSGTASEAESWGNALASALASGIATDNDIDAVLGAAWNGNAAFSAIGTSGSASSDNSQQPLPW